MKIVPSPCHDTHHYQSLPKKKCSIVMLVALVYLKNVNDFVDEIESVIMLAESYCANFEIRLDFIRIMKVKLL